MRIFVGNLSFRATESDLFAAHGTVERVNIVMDRETGKSRGFGFVEMLDGAIAAIAALNGTEFMGRPLTVNQARPKGSAGEGGIKRNMAILFFTFQRVRVRMEVGEHLGLIPQVPTIPIRSRQVAHNGLPPGCLYGRP